jgi:hypothetical protein
MALSMKTDQPGLALFPQPPFAGAIIAGFECGLVHGGRHDLLRTTRHLASQRMGTHFEIVKAHGMRAVRDGLTPGHDTAERLRTARDYGLDAIWDLSHFHRIDDPLAHARDVARAALSVCGSARLWLCPVNEPSLYPRLAGLSRDHAIDMAVTMADEVRSLHPNVGILVNDPITGIGERQYAATDAVIARTEVDIVGVNYYPHTARAPLSKVLAKTWRRYGKPVMVSETSWHDGHPVHHRRHPGFDKGAWLRHVMSEVEIARGRGVQIAGTCWYPVVDCPPWHAPRARHRWSHGLIRNDLGVDPHLSAALLSFSRTGAGDEGLRAA